MQRRSTNCSTLISEVNEMRKASLAVSFALAFVLAAGAMRVVSAQVQRPQTIAPASRPTTTTLTGTVLSNTAAAPWIIFKWGPAENDILHIRVSHATSFVQNGRLVSRSAVQANMQAQITGYYYGTQINFGTKFNATKVVILAALRPQPVNSARLPSGYHRPAPQSGPPSNGPLRAAPPPPAYGRAPAPPPPEFRPAPAPAASPQAPSASSPAIYHRAGPPTEYNVPYQQPALSVQPVAKAGAQVAAEAQGRYPGQLLPQPYFQVQGNVVYDPRGLAYDVTATATSGSGQILNNFTGPISLSSTDPSALVSSAAATTEPVSQYSYQFTACASGCDNGAHTFYILIPSSKIDDVISITGPNGMTGKSSPLGLQVKDTLSLALYELSGNSPSVSLGEIFGASVTAMAPNGTQDHRYTGTIKITDPSDPLARAGGGTLLTNYSYTFTSDVGASSSAQYPDQRANDGMMGLNIIPGTLGPQTYTVTDTASGESGAVTVTVVPALPAATTAATPEIWKVMQLHQAAVAQSLALQDFAETAMAYDASTGRMVLLGEDNASGTVWVSTNDGANWSQAGCSGPALSGAAMAYDAATKQVLIFGGDDYVNGGAQAQTWVSDSGDCFHMVSPANVPPPRAWASLAYDPVAGLLVLFGGTGSGGGLWSWDGLNWTRHAASGSAPAPRQDAMLAWDGNTSQLLVFGGGDGQAMDNNDTWELDTSRWSWQQMSPAHQPPPRHNSDMQWDAGYSGDVLFGGAAGALFTTQGTIGEQQFNDTWLWNGSDWQALQASYVTVNANGQPGARDGAGMAYDSSSGWMVLEGGSELLSPPPTQNGTAVNGQNCGGCTTSATAPQNSTNSGTPAGGLDTSQEMVEAPLDDTWELPAPTGLKLLHPKYYTPRLPGGAVEPLEEH